MAFKFEKLEVWKLAIELANDVHFNKNVSKRRNVFSYIANEAGYRFYIIKCCRRVYRIKFLGYSQHSAML